MICHILHFEYQQQSQWGVLFDGKLFPLAQPYSSTGDFLERGRDAAYRLQAEIESGIESVGLDPNSVTTLSPVTRQAQVLCQGANYRQQMIDSGMDPDAKVFNMFFTKSSVNSPASVTLIPVTWS